LAKVAEGESALFLGRGKLNFFEILNVRLMHGTGCSP
jgi:hypothetical protein